MTKIVLICAMTMTLVSCALKEVRTNAIEELYEQGIGYQNNGDTTRCIDEFKKIVELKKTTPDALYIMSLYRMGLCYEMTTQYDKAISVYQDALHVRSIAPSEIYLFEIPLRLSISYRRIGDANLSEYYLNSARRFMGEIRGQKEALRSNRDYYSELFLRVSRLMYQTQGESIADILNLSGVSTDYLSAVIEIGKEEDKKKASQEILKIFQYIKDRIFQIPIVEKEDDLLAQRERQELQKQLSQELLTQIDSFKRRTSPLRSYYDFRELFKNLAVLKDQLASKIRERPYGEGLTEEAKNLKKNEAKKQFIPLDSKESPLEERHP